MNNFPNEHVTTPSTQKTHCLPIYTLHYLYFPFGFIPYLSSGYCNTEMFLLLCMYLSNNCLLSSFRCIIVSVIIIIIEFLCKLFYRKFPWSLVDIIIIIILKTVYCLKGYFGIHAHFVSWCIILILELRVSEYFHDFI